MLYLIHQHFPCILHGSGRWFFGFACCCLHYRGRWFFTTEHSCNAGYPFLCTEQADIGFHLVFHNFLKHEEMRIGLSGNLWLMCDADDLSFGSEFFHNDTDLPGRFT